MENFSLTIDLKNNSSLRTFLIALDDKSVYDELSERKSSLPIAATQILEMLADDKFKNSSKSIAAKFRLFKEGNNLVEEIKSEGLAFHEYLTKTYPIGYKRLQEVGGAILPRGNSFRNDIETGAAVAVESVTVATVWANVSAVTNIAVVAEAVAVVGVFVI